MSDATALVGGGRLVWMPDAAREGGASGVWVLQFPSFLKVADVYLSSLEAPAAEEEARRAVEHLWPELRSKLRAMPSAVRSGEWHVQGYDEDNNCWRVIAGPFESKLSAEAARQL